MSWTNSADRALREREQAVIPGGMYGHQSVMLLPDDYPQFFARASGAYMWDVDGNRYVDFMCGYGPSLFGYGVKEIDEAYIARMKEGIVSSMNSPWLREGVMIEILG